MKKNNKRDLGFDALLEVAILARDYIDSIPRLNNEGNKLLEALCETINAVQGRNKC